MRLVRRLALPVFLALTVVSTHSATKTQARLILSEAEARPGETVTAGVLMKMPAGWHTYWKNSGDSGEATKIKWQLPDGAKAGEIQWPIPEKLTVAGLTTYVYHDEVLLMVPLTLSDDVAPGTKTLKAQVSWLECEKVCVPGKAEVEATLEVGTASKPSAERSLFDAWKKKLPVTNANLAVSGWWEKEADGDSRPLILEVGMADAEDFFPYSNKTFEVQAPTETVSSNDGRVRFRKVVKKYEGDWPKTIEGIVVAKAGASPASLEVIVPIASVAPTEPVATTTVNSGTEPNPGAGEAAGFRVPERSLPLMLVFAFLGGLILNVMPCVLPVIALKVLGFLKQSKESPTTVRQHGLLYGLGVLVSFLVLAGVVVAVQAAGHKASWGMQFGNPIFLVAMTTLVTLVALNLFGVFEVTLSGKLMGAAGNLAGREGAGGAFFNGVLATALATPCTAPFLSLALGFAFTQSSAPMIVLMFLTIGFGLAAPYVLLSFVPGLGKFLPKPGAWMERFKVAMGFPMLATAVWLFDLAIGHYRDVLWLGFFLVMLALAVWIFGEFVQRGRSHKGLALGIAMLVLGIGYGYGLEMKLHWRTPPPPELAGDEIIKESPDGIEWHRWSRAAVEKARSQNHPVLVDFTAKWCATCQVNKNTSIEISSVRKKLNEINAVSLLADYTNLPDNITEELERFGRAAVPLVVVYPKNPKTDPIILPEILTPSIVLAALDKAAQ